MPSRRFESPRWMGVGAAPEDPRKKPVSPVLSYRSKAETSVGLARVLWR